MAVAWDHSATDNVSLLVNPVFWRALIREAHNGRNNHLNEVRPLGLVGGI